MSMTLPDDAPSLADILAAQGRIAGVAVETPLAPAVALSRRLDADILFKLDLAQPTGAFKLRGAANAVAQLGAESRARGVVCASTGNHGRAVAHAAARLGVRAVVCLPEMATEVKVAAVAAEGADVRRVGRDQDAAQAEVDRLVAEEGLVEISPFDHADVIAGQGTMAVEMLRARPDLETIVTPLSGGGLASGIALAAKAMNPRIRIVGVSMARGPAMALSIAAGRVVDVVEEPTLADSLGGGLNRDNRYTLPICAALLDEIALVSEAEIYRGVRWLLREERLIVEGGASVGVAALLAGKAVARGPTAVVVCGRNAPPEQIAAILDGRPVRLGDEMIDGGEA